AHPVHFAEKELGLRIALLRQRRRFLERFGVILVHISAPGGLEIRCGGKQRAKQDHERANRSVPYPGPHLKLLLSRPILTICSSNRSLAGSQAPTTKRIRT